MTTENLSPLRRAMLQKQASSGAMPPGTKLPVSSSLLAAAARGAVVTVAASSKTPLGDEPGVNQAIGFIPDDAISPNPNPSPGPEPGAAPIAADSTSAPLPLTGANLLGATLAGEIDRKDALASMAAAKSLTRLLEAVYCRPGNLASADDKRLALAKLAMESRELAQSYVDMLPPELGRSSYTLAMAMDAVVTLQCRAWEEGREIDWRDQIAQAMTAPEVVQASNLLSDAVYQKATSKETAQERLSLSMHSAFWRIYQTGKHVDGLTGSMTARCTQEIASYLNDYAASKAWIKSPDLLVSWMQGSIGRITDLFCAELKARQARDPSWKITDEDLNSVLEQAKSGFQSVERFAQGLLSPEESLSQTHTPS